MNQMSFIGVSYRIVSIKLHIGAEMSQRQLHHKGPSQHRWQVTKFETWITLNSLWHLIGWLVSFPSVSVGLNLFQVAYWSQSHFVAWLCSSERDSLLLLLTLVRRGLVNLVSFREFLKLFQVVYTSLFKWFFCKMECLNLGEIYTTVLKISTNELCVKKNS